MNQNQGVHAALSDQPGREHGLTESRGGSQDTSLVRQHRLCSRFLFGAQRAAEEHVQSRAAAAFVADHGLDLQRAKQLLNFLKATARQGVMFWMIFGAMDYSRLVVGWQTH